METKCLKLFFKACKLQNKHYFAIFALAKSPNLLTKSKSMASCSLVCIGVTVISSVSYYRTAFKNFLSLAASQSHSKQEEEVRLGKFLNSCTAATDPQSTTGSYRLPYPTTAADEECAVACSLCESKAARKKVQKHKLENKT